MLTQEHSRLALEHTLLKLGIVNILCKRDLHGLMLNAVVLTELDPTVSECTSVYDEGLAFSCNIVLNY